MGKVLMFEPGVGLELVVPFAASDCKHQGCVVNFRTVLAQLQPKKIAYHS